MVQESELNEREDGDESDGAGSVSPLEVLVFLTRAAKRHPRLGVGIAVLVSVVGVLVAIMLPAKFESESRVLAVQSAAVTAALSNPNRQVPQVEPFAGSTEILMQKSNLRWLIQEGKVLSRWSSARSAPLRLKDAVFGLLFGQVSEEVKKKVLAEILEKQMFVYHDATTMTIHVMWQDPESALRIAQLAESKFLEIRRGQELAAITAAISVNEDEVKHTADEIERTLRELLEVKKRAQNAASEPQSSEPAEGSSSSSGKHAGRIATAAPRQVDAPAPDKHLSSQLAEIRQQAREAEAPWQHRLADLKFQLNDLRSSYGPEHPMVIQQEAKIRAASTPPPELSSLRDKERQLLAELERETLESGSRVAASPVSRSIPVRTEAIKDVPTVTKSRFQSPDGTLVIAEKEEDPALAPAKASLTAAIQRYADAVRRLDTARIELATSEVAFKYKYTVVGEPEKANKPTKPNRLVIALGAIGAALVLGALAGAVRDLISGSIFEPWQVQFQGVRVLGELDLRRAPKSDT